MNSIPTVAHVIQLALTPIFLIGAVSAILNVMAGRLARAVDRYRYLTENNSTTPLASELAILQTRVRLSQWAIILCIICACFVSISIVILFLGAELELNLSRFISVLFIIAITAFTTGLIFFLREISLAAETITSTDK